MNLSASVYLILISPLRYQSLLDANVNFNLLLFSEMN